MKINIIILNKYYINRKKRYILYGKKQQKKVWQQKN